jgi:hypothetical protein
MPGRALAKVLGNAVSRVMLPAQSLGGGDEPRDAGSLLARAVDAEPWKPMFVFRGKAIRRGLHDDLVARYCGNGRDCK